jgi:hypothetical protein
MKLVLPRVCSGEEVLEAFKLAASLEVGDKKWEARSSVDAFQYVPGSVKREPRTMTVTASRLLRGSRKKWIFFGKTETRWVESDLEILLTAKLREDYKEVDIRALNWVSGYDMGSYESDPEPDSDFEKVLERFFSILKPEIQGAPA